MRVENMKSSSGRSVPNQFVIVDDRGGHVITFFQSYKTIIAMKKGEQLYLDKHFWNYSRTTSRYRNMFTGMSTKETETAIKEGTIQLVSLNDTDHNVMPYTSN